MTGELQIINKEILYGQVMVQIDDNDVEILMVQQFKDLFITINRFQIACFYSTITGQLLHKQVLPENAQIEEGYIFERQHDLQLHDEPSNQFFNQHAKTLISSFVEHDKISRLILIAKLKIVENPDFQFDISFETLFRGIITDNCLGN